MATIKERQLENAVQFWKERAMNALHDRNNYKSLLEIAESALKACASVGSAQAKAGLFDLKTFRDAIEASRNQEEEVDV